MIRAALLALLAASPAAAQDWAGVVRLVGDIRSEDPALAYKAATAACVAGRGDPDWTVMIFQSAGWAYSKEDEPGLDVFQSPHPDVYVLMASDGSFCAAYSESQGTDTATANVFQIIVAGMLSADSAKTEMGCTAFALAPGVVAEVTSSGNDPVCDDRSTSSVRISFAASP